MNVMEEHHSMAKITIKSWPLSLVKFTATFFSIEKWC